MPPRKKGDSLTEYRRKRDFRTSPEPSGQVAASASRQLRYVIQKHAASNLHFDLRLEMGGVMKSWALPKGPSLDPSVKRLAMEVEDHPIEYNAFEGTIPEGQYGGGTVMLWDVGTYGPEHPDDGDPEAAIRAGYEKGDLKIVFEGARLQGSWVLVRMKRPGKPQWLFIKHRDEHVSTAVDIVAETPTSVATGRTMDEIGADESDVWESNRRVSRVARRATRSSRILSQLERIEADTGSGTLELPDGATLKVTSLGKKYFTAPDVTKGAVMRYYVQVATGLLPAIADRPLVLKRMPEGMNGEAFFQHKPPAGAPDVMRIADVQTENGMQPRVIGGGIGTVLALVQFGVISMDPWHSRIDSLDEPDYAFLDLDPGPRATFDRVVEVALAVREEIDSLGLHGVPRTSGSRGAHIALPLPRGMTYDAALVLAQIVATRVANAHPRIATVERAVKRRADDAVYVDYLQNMRGKSIASAYSVRARAGATVATPLVWDEVSPGLDPTIFTVETVPARYAEVGDLWRAGMRKPNTMQAVKRLAGD